MKVLFICNKSPYPPKEGGAIAMNALVEGMARAGHHVKVLAVSSEKFAVNPQEVPDDYCRMTGLETVELDLRIKPVSAFLNLFSTESFHVQRFISPRFAGKIRHTLEKETFDIVQLETLYMTPYVPLIREYSQARIVLRTHNIEHLIWEEIASGKHHFLKKAYLRHLAYKLKNFELKALAIPDGIAAITDQDAEFIAKSAPGIPVETIGFGVYPEEYGPAETADELPRDIFHIGSMNWLPNEEGIRWFLKTVWPEVTELHPSYQLYLAGRSMPEWLLHYHRSNIEILGEVENAWDFMTSHGIMVVPLFSGSGVRIKIIQAMLAARPVISTTKGAEGLACRDEEHILIADTHEDFVSAITRCMTDPAFARQLGRNARELILKEHNNSLIISRLTQFYERLDKPGNSEASKPQA